MSKLYAEKEAHYISAWGYIGYSLLMAIPLVGFILTIVFSFSDNDNLRHYARSYWCWLLLTLILVGVIAAIFAITGENLAASLSRELARIW